MTTAITPNQSKTQSAASNSDVETLCGRMASLDSEQNFFAGLSTQSVPPWRQYVNGLISSEISALSRYYDELVQWNPQRGDSGLLLRQIDCGLKSVATNYSELPNYSNVSGKRVIFLLNGTFNHELDIQGLLQSLRQNMNRSSRVVAVVYNAYFSWLYKLASQFGIREAEEPCTFVTETDLRTLAKISGFEVCQMRYTAYFPFKLFGLGDLINKIMPCLPVLQWLCLTAVAVLRPVVAEKRLPSLSVIIPARNERGNIEEALKRMPSFNGAQLEIIFVEGHSTDNTWEEIERVVPLYSGHFDIRAFKQPGKGKSDAVRLGFAEARNDVLVILDADLSVPPELLTRFYDAYCQGLGDFVNGSRLVYPIEGQAMKFLNKLGNIFFAKALSAVLGVRLGDSLCGTKMFSADTYRRMVAWRNDFGDFDPFGDFEMLFPAAQLALGIVDVPIRYRDRLYGSTNIRRFYHGMMLLKMTLIGLLKITLGRTKGAC